MLEFGRSLLLSPKIVLISALPFDQSKCRNRADCNVVFTAGDSRVNLFVGLSAWHTIFTREHNR